jgi:hypothetical protein
LIEILSLSPLVMVWASLHLANEQEDNVHTSANASSSLVRIFVRLRKHGRMTVGTRRPSESPEAQIAAWLDERYNEFMGSLCALLTSKNPHLQVSYAVAVLILAHCTCTGSSPGQGRNGIKGGRECQILQLFVRQTGGRTVAVGRFG